MQNLLQTPPAIDAKSFQDEQRVLFSGGWIAAASRRQVAEPGDLLGVSVGDRPILIARDQNGALQAYENICPHRGAQLVEGRLAKQAVIRCPYHSWSFSLAGRLIATPHIGGHGVNRDPAVDPASFGLTPVRVAERHGLIFIDLSGEAPPLERHLEPLERRWPVYLSSPLEHGGSVHFDVRANWKLAAENFVESYHLPWVHPGVNSYSAAEDHYDVIVPPLLIGQGNRAAAAAPVLGGLTRFPDLPDEAERTGEFLLIFPNALVIAMPDHYATIIMTPIAPDRTLERFDFWFLTDEDRTAERQAVIDRWAEINAEDQNILERLQRGRGSPAFTGGVLTPRWERPVAAFYDFYASAMATS